jgi:hypothetical protein
MRARHLDGQGGFHFVGRLGSLDQGQGGIDAVFPDTAARQLSC